MPMAAKVKALPGVILCGIQNKVVEIGRGENSGKVCGLSRKDGKGCPWILSFEEYACFHQPFSFYGFFVLFYKIGSTKVNEAYGTYGLFIN